MNLSDYIEMWVLDTEYGADTPGENPIPVCLCAKELLTGQEVRLLPGGVCPFKFDANILFIGFNVKCEWIIFLVFGWVLPLSVIDLMVEYKNLYNGKTMLGWGLLDALRHYNLPCISNEDKEHGRTLARHMATRPQSSWLLKEIQEILEYCFSDDVIGTEKLWYAMKSEINIGQALLRGRYTCAAARIEFNGIPMDVSLHNALITHKEDLQRIIIVEANKRAPLFEGLHFRESAFEEWLDKNGLYCWPRTADGSIDLKDDTFKDLQGLHPDLPLIRDARSFLSKLRFSGYPIGQDGYSRTNMWVFGQRTGRNTYSGSEFPFLGSSWSRVVIRPKPGWGLAYIDYCAQEIAIAAALSGDSKMIESYKSGDFHFSFAILSGAIPQGTPCNKETKNKYRPIRDQFKTAAFGVGYGMQYQGLSSKIGALPAKARMIMQAHRDLYPVYHKWSEAVADWAFSRGYLRTIFGWHLYVMETNSKGRSNGNAAKNFPMQAHGAEMTRIACIRATEMGVRVCCPVHDALLVEGPLDQLEDIISKTQACMLQASIDTIGMECRTDVKKILYPERYVDDRNIETWDLVRNALETNGWWKEKFI